MQFRRVQRVWNATDGLPHVDLETLRAHGSRVRQFVATLAEWSTLTDAWYTKTRERIVQRWEKRASVPKPSVLQQLRSSTALSCRRRTRLTRGTRPQYRHSKRAYNPGWPAAQQACCSALVAACGGGGGGAVSGGGSCSETNQKNFVLDVAREWYLFQSLLPPTVSVGDYATAEELLDALTATARAQNRDRFFSYLTTPQADSSFLQAGQFIGFGFRTRIEGNSSGSGGL